jgi:hypothetical protein
MYRTFRAEGGGVVEIELVNEAAMPPRPDGRANWEEAGAAEREAAWEAFKALRNAGWSSDGRKLTRDELHEKRVP